MYCGVVSVVDDMVGRIVDALSSKHLLDETAIIFTTDHGDMLGDHRWGRKCVPYEGSCRTPVIVRYPKELPSGIQRKGLIEAVDLPATILNACGFSAGDIADALPRTPGRSFWHYAAHGGDTFRPSAYAEMGDESGNELRWRMVVKGGWKYVYWPSAGDLLFDLENDPQETANLADDESCMGKKVELSRELLDRVSSLRIPGVKG